MHMYMCAGVRGLSYTPGLASACRAAHTTPHRTHRLPSLVVKRKPGLWDVGGWHKPEKARRAQAATAPTPFGRSRVGVHLSLISPMPPPLAPCTLYKCSGRGGEGKALGRVETERSRGYRMHQGIPPTWPTARSAGLRGSRIRARITRNQTRSVSSIGWPSGPRVASASDATRVLDVSPS